MARSALPTAGVWGIFGLLATALSAPTMGQQTKAAARPGSPDNAPVIATITPPAATIGKTTEWAVTGRNLGKVERWLISGKGIVAVETRPTTTPVGPSSETAITVVVKADESAEPGFREVRAVGPNGISNFAMIRVDRLEQSVETEPNDEPAKANEVAFGSAVVGVLKAQDIDHFRVKGKAGTRATIEVEAQRLGTPVVPVMTVMTAEGTPLAQAYESRGAERDSRLTFTFPADGDYIIQVRDNLYGGGDSAAYRLRVADTPFATGIFPLGGPKGQTIAVTASGGNLASPITRSVPLPDKPGEVVEVGPFEGPGGPVLAPGKLIVGEGPEVVENADGSPTPLPFGTTANGRIDRPGEVDRYAVKVKKGDRLGVRVRAAALGSALDSVLTLKDEKGDVVDERDDLVDSNVPQRQVFNNVVPSMALDAADSRLEYEAKQDGELTVEVADRYGDGGPEYAYRLEVGPPRPDFSITLLLDPNTNANQRQVAVGRRQRPNTPGITGSLNLRPGSTTTINFVANVDGKTGPITVRAEGLPPGVTANDVTIRPTAPAGRNAMNRGPQPTANGIVLRAAPDAEAELGELRIVGEASPEGGPKIVRTAVAILSLDTNPTATQARAVNRVVSIVPVRVLGEEKKPEPIALAGPPKPVRLELKGVKVPGPLFPGDRLDLALELDPPKPPADAVQIEVDAGGRGLSAQAFPAAPPGSAPGTPSNVVRLTASPGLAMGSREVVIKIQPLGGDTIVKTVTVDVKAPIRVEAKSESIRIADGGKATLWVVVRREEGYTGRVDLAVNGLPPGVRVLNAQPLKPDETEAKITLARAKDTPLREPVALRVTGMARVLRGTVRVDCAVKPMLMDGPGE
jgi:hypothetical protein